MEEKIHDNKTFNKDDFSEADLTSSAFINCDLSRCLFRQTILEKADLRSANNYSIDPEVNRIKNARFSASGVFGLLDKYQIKID